jgi:hypothetical protein
MNDLQQRARLESLVSNQIDPASGLAINCHNCIHCERSSCGAAYDKCRKSGGNYCQFIQQFPLIHGHLCKNYSAWAPRQKTILELISDRIRKMLTHT